MTNSKMSRRQFMSTTALGGSAVALSPSVEGWFGRDQPAIVARVRDSVLYVNEQAVFPFGFYFEHAGSLETHRKGLQQMASLGCNVTYISLGDGDKSRAELSVIYDEAHKLGIWIIGESPLFEFEDGTLAVNAFKKQPACLGWTVGDDIMDRTPEELSEIARQVAKNDPNHLIYASSNGIQREQRIRIEDFLYTGLDAMAVQAYPVPSPRHWWNQEPGVKDIRLVYYRCRRLVQALEPVGKLPLCNPQAFEWWYQPDDRYPTAAETNNMVYQCLIAGIKGILAYTLNDCCRSENQQPGRYFFDAQPALKQTWIRLANEIQTLTPYLLHGTRYTLPVDPSFDWVLAAVWEYEEKTLIIATNTSSESQPARIPLAGLPSRGTVTQVFSDRPGGMQIADGFLRGTLGSLEVHVYEVKT